VYAPTHYNVAIAINQAARTVPEGTVRVGRPPMLPDRYQSRPDLTSRFDQAASNTGTVVLAQVLSGTGGVGKTQLAAPTPAHAGPTRTCGW
jgi:hypothetical protein